MPRSVLERRKVIVCAGPGGVGKTTTAAALAVLGARRGLRVAALTVDPARRLADSLGIGDPGAEPREVDPAAFRGQEPERGGRLTVMMMDTKRTFDELVERHASSPAARDRILGNELYQHVSSHLAGVHEYMAMEKLLNIKNGGQYDLIILDTPPTRDALDFLSAPERMVGALDSSLISWFGQALHPTRGFGLGLVARGVSRVLSTMGRITGHALLERLAVFIVDLNDLFGGFRERATAVSKAFRGPEFGFMIVSSAREAALRESLELGTRLAEDRMALDGFILNRWQEPSPLASPEAIERALGQALPGWDRANWPGLSEKVAAVASTQNRAAEADAERFGKLSARLLALSPALPLVRVPELPADVQGLGALGAIADALAKGLIAR